MKTFTVITTAFVLSGSILSVAEAIPPSNVPSAIIKLRDLDITRPAGKEELYRRLIRAAQAVCSPVDPNGPVLKPLLTRQYQTCIDQAVSGAVARFNRPDFSEYVVARQPNGANARIHFADRP